MLDVKKLSKNIRTMKTLLKMSLLTDAVKNRMQNLENHIIDVDDTDENDPEPLQEYIQN